MGFAMEVPPLECEIQESFYFPAEGNLLQLRQVSGAWCNIQRKGKVPFGKVNSMSFPPFDDWLRKRIELTHIPFPGGDPWCPLIKGPRSSVSMEEFLKMKKARDQLQAEKTELEMSVARIQMANQEIKGRIEDQDKRHAIEVKRFEIDTTYYRKINQALESSTKEHDFTKEKLARALRVIEDEKRRQILVKNQRDARAKVLATEWETEKAKIIAERDHYLAERDHYFRQMKIHQKEIGRLQQENTELRFAVKFTKMVDDAEPSVGPSSAGEARAASAANSGVNLEGVSNHGLGGFRDGGDLGKKTTVGVVINNGGGFGAATSGRPGPMGNNMKDNLFPPFFGAEEDREEDREADQFSMLNEQFGQYGVQPPNKKIHVLAEKIRALESHATLGVVNMSNMGLVEGIVIPQKFKAPAFDKYNGSSCSETHLQAFVRKISSYTMDQKLWMYFFQDSLSGGSLEWYTKLKSSDIKSWQDLGDAFFKQYQFNADMAPSRTQL
ncbi:hypothetical protein KIW84_061344 [Lathyrus oleraceus]|uniref:Retrotransposon gag domain-containing protein n=1 Tax=Pisum sativum TaxID=3888 RepID=A0A9D5A270_PEA|nr:hypothetical protein KIW84_061344 [Pisum sativum]